MESRSSANHITLYFNTLAIFHLLKDKVKPFAGKETDPVKIQWVLFDNEFSMSDLFLSISKVKSPK